MIGMGRQVAFTNKAAVALVFASVPQAPDFVEHG
jgi:hypothetical protein